MGNGIKFLLNGEERQAADISPNTTVLDYLRLNENRRGTKEGCAEGDCGACTVVLGETDAQGMRYRAVNSCILFVPELDGKLLLTVEGLQDRSGALHPVQAALADHHGSQCGYCTPGFVMTLFALHHEPGPIGDEAILDALAGNLCRCTGYRPIIAAARATAGRRSDSIAPDTERLAESLRATKGKPAAAISLEAEGERYDAPASLADLERILAADPEAHLLAGGTDLGLLVTKQHHRLTHIVSLNRIKELRAIEETERELEIGAAATYTEALPAIERNFPSFASLIRRLGSWQIRNLGSMGGNVANASPIGDSPPALLALGASAVLRSAAGERVLPLEDFFLAYRKTALRKGEYLKALRLPKPAGDAFFRTYKVSKRFDQDISAVCGAFWFRIEDGRLAQVRIAYGGMAAIPKRALAAEAAMQGRAPDEATLAAAIAALEADFSPIDDFRASAAYRRLVAGNLLRRAMTELADPKATVEVAQL